MERRKGGVLAVIGLAALAVWLFRDGAGDIFGLGKPVASTPTPAPAPTADSGRPLLAVDDLGPTGIPADTETSYQPPSAGQVFGTPVGATELDWRRDYAPPSRLFEVLDDGAFRARDAGQFGLTVVEPTVASNGDYSAVYRSELAAAQQPGALVQYPGE